MQQNESNVTDYTNIYPTKQQLEQMIQPPTKKSTPLRNVQYLADFISGSISALAVSPIVLAVDQALAESASGRATLMGSFTNSIKCAITSPIKFITNPAFKWVYLIYSGTYLTSNWCKTVCDQRNMDTTFPLWLSTSIINTGLCVNKDYHFSRLFSTNIPKPVPPTSLSIWVVRDCTSMFAFFTLPPIVAEIVKDYTGNEELSKYSAQFVVPLVFQYILTPIHRLGYDKYNNPHHSPKQVWEFLKTDYFTSSHLRMIRCIPPWSIGVIANNSLREKLGSKLAV